MVISPTQHGELKLGMTTHIDSPSYWGTGTRPGVGNVLLRSYYDAQWSRKLRTSRGRRAENGSWDSGKLSSSGTCSCWQQMEAQKLPST